MSYCPNVYPAPGGGVSPPLTLLTSSLPTAYVGVPYSATLTAEGGTGPYSWDLATGTLPAWATLNASTGLTTTITGTPDANSTTLIAPRITDSLAVSDTNGDLTLTVETLSGELTLITTSLNAATRGTVYTATLAASGGTPPYAWSLVSPNNVLQTGLSLAGNQITGTPTVAESKTVTLRVTDNVAATVDRTFTLIVNEVAALTITTPSTLPRKEQNVATSITFTTAGGWGAITWSLLSGSYPVGMTRSGAVLSGTPTTVQTATFTLRATDTEARTADRTFALTIDAEGTAEGPHDFYLDQIALGDLLAGTAHTLRTQGDLDSLRSTSNSAYISDIWTYDAAADAAKFVMPHSLGTPNQLIIDLNAANLITGSILAVADSRWSQECIDNVVPASGLQHKWWQFEGKSFSGSTLYIEPRISFKPNVVPDTVGSRDLRTYATDVLASDPGSGVTAGTPYTPSGPGAIPVDSWSQRPNIWTRDYILLELGKPGTDFTEWNAQYNGGVPLCTSNIHAAVIDGADTILTVDDGTITATSSKWVDRFTNPVGCRITIAGNSDGALNGIHDVQQVDTTHVRVLGVASTGTGGTISKHFTMFTWVHTEEDTGLRFFYYRVPIIRYSTGQIKAWRMELNTSKGIETLKGFFIETAPTIANPTVLNIGLHDIVDGASVWISESDVIPQGPYTASYVSSTEISIPVSVTSTSVVNPDSADPVDRLNFGDIGAGDTFTLSFRDDVSGVVAYSADMTAAITAAIDAMPGQATPTVTRISDSVYTTTVDTTRSNLMLVTNPVGFTPVGTTRLSNPVVGGYYANTYGRVSKPLIGHVRNMFVRQNPTVDFDDATLFRRPVA